VATKAKTKKKPTKKKRAKGSNGHYARANVVRLKVADLEDAPYNARTITQKALKGLFKSLEEFGLVHLPVVNKRKKKYRIIGGHQRVLLLRREGVEHVWCIVVEVPDDVERKANFTLNNRAIQGEFVPELTRDLLDRIRGLVDNADAKDSPFKLLNFDELVKRVSRNMNVLSGENGQPIILNEGRVDEDAEPQMTKTKADSQVGTIYELGDHRIHCGGLKGVGSLKAFGVADDVVDMAFTRIADPKTLSEGYLDSYLGTILEGTRGAVYIVTTTRNLAQIQQRFEALHGHWSTTLMWVYPEASPSVDERYRDVLIPVIYGWPEGADRQFYGEKRISNVFTLKRAPKNKLPVEIAIKAYALSSCDGDNVLDVDVGDGSSVIAASMTPRHLIGYVRTAHACDKVRRRWAEFIHGPKCNWKALTPKRSG